MARDEEKRPRRREEQPEREESSRAERKTAGNTQGTPRGLPRGEEEGYGFGARPAAGGGTAGEAVKPTRRMQGGQQRTGVDAYGQSATGMPQGGAGIMREPREGAPGFGVQADGVDGTEPQLPIEPMGKAARHIGEKEIADAAETLRKYKTGKANLEARIIDNEQWWKLRHWQSIRHGGDRDPKPTSAWLVNACLAKHADAMAAYPEANMLPREPGDRDEAKRLSSIVPVILQQADYEMTWSDSWWKKIKSGVGVTGVFWDPSKLNGMGDITIREVDPLCVFWEPGVTDIQESSHFFQTQLVPNERLEAAYPELAGRLTGQSLQISEYIYDDSVDTTDKSVVVDWYYKRRSGEKTVLHYCKFVNDHVLYASEDDPELAERGWYDHGLYPYVFDVLYPEEGTPAGFGQIDLCKDAQEQIDLMNNAILKNTLAAATPRWFVRNDGAINEEEYLDLTKPFIHTNANLGQDSILPVTVQGLGEIYVSVLDRKIEEMKETSGNRDVSNGGTTAGVTAASAIATMQEQSGKLSRDQLQNSYRAFRQVVYLVIELIRQNYDLPRQFRITGELGEEQFVSYDNRALRPQMQQTAGVETGLRAPVFDIEVTAQKQNAYSKMSQNELAIQLYQLGVFNPQMADQSLAMLDMMEFKGREQVMQKVQQNGTLMQLLQQTQMQLISALQMVDAQNGTDMAQQYVAGQTGQAVPAAGGAGGAASAQAETDELGGAKQPEHAFVRKAREKAERASTPE